MDGSFYGVGEVHPAVLGSVRAFYDSFFWLSMGLLGVVVSVVGVAFAPRVLAKSPGSDPSRQPSSAQTESAVRDQPQTSASRR